MMCCVGWIMKTLFKYLSYSGIYFRTEWMVEILEKSIEIIGMERPGIDVTFEREEDKEKLKRLGAGVHH